MEELNVKAVIPCSDLLKYVSLHAEPDIRYVLDVCLDKIPAFVIVFSMRLFPCLPAYWMADWERL